MPWIYAGCLAAGCAPMPRMHVRAVPCAHAAKKLLLGRSPHKAAAAPAAAAKAAAPAGGAGAAAMSPPRAATRQLEAAVPAAGALRAGCPVSCQAAVALVAEVGQLRADVEGRQEAELGGLRQEVVALQEERARLTSEVGSWAVAPLWGRVCQSRHLLGLSFLPVVCSVGNAPLQADVKHSILGREAATTLPAPPPSCVPCRLQLAIASGNYHDAQQERDSLKRALEEERAAGKAALHRAQQQADEASAAGHQGRLAALSHTSPTAGLAGSTESEQRVCGTGPCYRLTLRGWAVC